METVALGLGLFGMIGVARSCSSRRIADQALASVGLAFGSYLHREFLRAVYACLQGSFLQVAWLELLYIPEVLEEEEHMDFVVVE